MMADEQISLEDRMRIVASMGCPGTVPASSNLVKAPPQDRADVPLLDEDRVCHPIDGGDPFLHDHKQLLWIGQNGDVGQGIPVQDRQVGQLAGLGGPGDRLSTGVIDAPTSAAESPWASGATSLATGSVSDAKSVYWSSGYPDLGDRAGIGTACGESVSS
jgi:hypothetical protein